MSRRNQYTLEGTERLAHLSLPRVSMPTEGQLEQPHAPTAHAATEGPAAAAIDAISTNL
jgi:hypothetical protein